MTTKSPKIAVFGSAFNPPTYGHLSVIQRLTHFDQVLLVPSIAHAWGKTMLEFETRCCLVESFISDIEQQNVELSRIEEQLFDGSSSVTTFALLSRIQEVHPQADITFVLGPDNFFSFSKFAKAEEIVSKWSVLACPQTVDVRSTKIRDNLLKGQSIEGLTTPSVKKRLIEDRLYNRMGTER